MIFNPNNTKNAYQYYLMIKKINKNKYLKNKLLNNSNSIRIFGPYIYEKYDDGYPDEHCIVLYKILNK